MKTIRLILAICSIAGLAFCETTNTFEIISYFPDKGSVWIKNEAGKTNRPFSSFSADEQREITGWLADSEFQASGLNVEIEKKKTTSKMDLETKRDEGEMGEIRRFGETDHISYIVTLGNRSKIPLENIELVYQIFYESREEEHDEERCLKGSNGATLKPGETLTLTTQPVLIRNEKIISDMPGGFDPFGGLMVGASTTYIKDRLLGMYLCISRKDSGGKIIKWEYGEGSVPSEKSRAKYSEKPRAKDKEQNANISSSAKSGNDIPGFVRRWTRADIQEHKKLAEEKDNYLSAYMLSQYYYYTRDYVSAKPWLEKTRELIQNRPNNQKAQQLLPDIEKMETTIADGKHRPSF